MFNQESEAKSVKRVGAEYTHILSQFQLLPDEVLSEIFIACLDKSTKKNPTFDTTTARMLLLNVSSRMRSVALRTPQLWAAVHMEFGPCLVPAQNLSGRFNEPLMKKMALHARWQSRELKQWLLKRSGALPLSITIKQRSSLIISKYFRDVADEVMGTLVACCPRWRDISLDFWSPKLSSITSFKDTNFPYLQSLHLQFQKAGDVPLHCSPILRARQLTELTLTRCTLSIAISLVAWQHITSLKFCGTLWVSNTTDWIGEILRRTTRLVHCDIAVPPLETGQPMNIIYLPFMETLAVEELGGYRVSRQPFILDRINAPALRRLVSRTRVFHPGHLGTLFARSHHVKELYLAYASAYKLKYDLRGCPSLETLRILNLGSSSIDQEPFLEAIASPSSDERLCPNLVSFRCSSKLGVPAGVVCSLYRRSGWTDLTIQSTDSGAQKEIERFSLEVPTIECKVDAGDPDTW